MRTFCFSMPSCVRCNDEQPLGFCDAGRQGNISIALVGVILGIRSALMFSRNGPGACCTERAMCTRRALKHPPMQQQLGCFQDLSQARICKRQPQSTSTPVLQARQTNPRDWLSLATSTCKAVWSQTTKKSGRFPLAPLNGINCCAG